MTTVTVAPYAEDGSLMHWAPPKPDLYGQPIDWRPNDPFELELTIDSMRSGRSAKYLVATDADGRTFPIFVTDLLDVLATEHGVRGGKTGVQRWIVGKRGKNYGLKLAPAVQARRRAA